MIIYILLHIILIITNTLCYDHIHLCLKSFHIHPISHTLSDLSTHVFLNPSNSILLVIYPWVCDNPLEHVSPTTLKMLLVKASIIYQYLSVRWELHDHALRILALCPKPLNTCDFSTSAENLLSTVNGNYLTSTTVQGADSKRRQRNIATRASVMLSSQSLWIICKWRA